MHDVIVKLKDGRTRIGPLWSWRPAAGWFTLAGIEETILLRNVESAVNRGVRVRFNETRDVDLLARAREEGWDGR